VLSSAGNKLLGIECEFAANVGVYIHYTRHIIKVVVCKPSIASCYEKRDSRHKEHCYSAGLALVKRLETLTGFEAQPFTKIRVTLPNIFFRLFMFVSLLGESGRAE